MNRVILCLTQQHLCQTFFASMVFWSNLTNSKRYQGRVLIFSDYLSALDILKIGLKNNNIDVLDYNGTLSKKEKDEAYRKFHKEDDIDIILMMISANRGELLHESVMCSYRGAILHEVRHEFSLVPPTL